MLDPNYLYACFCFIRNSQNIFSKKYLKWRLTFNESTTSFCPLGPPIWSKQSNRREISLLTFNHLCNLLQLSKQIFLIEPLEVGDHIKNKKLGK